MWSQTVTDQDPVEMLKTPPRDAAGRLTGSFSISRDITAADQVTEVETRCSYALQGSGLGVWDWNLESNKVYWSPVWLGMLGYQEGEISPSIAVWRRLLHPQDYDRVVAYGANFLNNPSGRYEIEFRLRHKEGRPHSDPASPTSHPGGWTGR